MRKLTKRDFVVPGVLLALSVVPMLGGIARLASLSAPTTVENARFVAAPAPVILHIFGATLYALLGAFQFSSGVRLRWPGGHRRAGRLLAVLGLLTGLTGMWMTALYPIPLELQGSILLGVRMLVGAAMVTAIILAWSSIRRRDFRRHEAWMIRAYALAQGAGTQVLVLGPWMLLTGEGVGPTRDLLMTLAWAINIGVAEWIILRRREAPRASASAVSASRA